ncbi:transcriptional regulator, AbrB family [Geoglobus ahangari]|uniref:Transcriptional regulator, AbrB family n=1 Tax=Geoglobus ahangari TaxID=113653 RepID=A0A0F7IE23_9EURY|nr:AbrB/MazE/SpoVT family DNA-binding domain-containing protein [Geoglobus ahangari]AKG90929.1 transcriptional regulator, AbrB family [Geoglobus ahangari]NOY11354.1 AbrB/MazE/SpoVT family DNA-binding domain-containing protein [Archaeoglobi archaeon]
MVIAKLDKRGRITIPKEIREELMLREDDELLIFKLSSNILVMRKIDFTQMINEALEEFKSLKSRDIEKIKQDVNEIAKEKIENLS